MWMSGDALSAKARSLHHYLLGLPQPILLTGLGSIALAASSDLANSFDAPRHGGPLVATLLLMTLVLAFVCFIRAAREWTVSSERRRARSLPPWTRWLIYPVMLWAMWTGAQTAMILAQGTATALTVAPPHYGSDDLYDNHFNALLVLHGENPYAGPWLVAEARYFTSTSFTPLARGRFTDPYRYPSRAEMNAVISGYLAQPQTPPPEIDPRTTHSYPAGAFLVDLPAVWAAAPSVAIEQIALALLLGVILIRVTPAPWRWPVALLLIANADGARQIVGSDFEIWPLALLAFAWLARERRWSSALLLGLACAIKQTAWLAAPFYLIWVWRRFGWQEAARRLGLAVGTFLAINLPWIFSTPRSWLTSMLLPVSLPLLPDGSGIVGLSLSGLFPLAPPMFYAFLEGAALAGALVWYWRSQSRYPFAGLILPLLPLIFAWRSSERYFVLAPVIAIVALVILLARYGSSASSEVDAHVDLDRPGPANMARERGT